MTTWFDRLCRKDQTSKAVCFSAEDQAVQATAQRQPGSAIRVGDGSQLLDPNWEADGEYWSFIRLGALAPPPALRAGASHRTNGKYEVRSILIDLLVDVGPFFCFWFL